MLIKLIDGVPSGNPVDDSNFRQLFPDTSFPKILTSDVLEPFGYGLYQGTPAPSVGRYEKAVQSSPVKNSSGIWEQSWTVEPMTAEERSNSDASKAAEIRDQRNYQLTLSDWTQLQDAPVDATTWATYRQELRDISSQDGFPWEVVWPTKP